MARQCHSDRISELPEPMLHCILSFLTMKQIARLSVLSKKWKQVSFSQPNLKFNHDFFRNYLLYLWENMFNDDWDRNQRSIHYELGKLLQVFDVVERYLTTSRDQNFAINKFELEMKLEIYRGCSSRIDQWIQQAIDRNVQELILCFHSLPHAGFYSLPQFVLLSKSIVTLTLRKCELPPIISRDFKINLSSLKKLNFDRVALGDFHMLQILIANVEDLTISRCKTLGELNISGSVKLKRIYLSQNYRLRVVHIEASSLAEAKFDKMVFLDTIDMRRCQNLRSITMTDMNILANYKWVIDEGVDYHPGIEAFSLIDSKMVNISMNSKAFLYSLEISRCSYPTAALDLNTRNLSEMFDFFSMFNGCCKVNVTCHTEECLIVPREVRQSTVSPLSNVKKLEIAMMRRSRVKLNTELIDSLFWINPNHAAIILCTKSRHDQHVGKSHTKYMLKTVSEEELRSIKAAKSCLKVYYRRKLTFSKVKRVVSKWSASFIRLFHRQCKWKHQTKKN
ncbi:hypothetical protein ACFE04_026464 [Oxalis oulophora]